MFDRWEHGDMESGTSYLMAEGLPGGRQRFIVSYSLRDGCHACERVGTARFALDFDSAGKFLGTKLINVTASSNQSNGFTPLPTAKCPSDQPIASCAIAPQQKHYTITLNLAQL